jgi:hypothetical protein
MSLVLNVEILGEFKKLTAATQGATKQLSGLQGTASKISSGIGKAFAAIGIGLSFAVITRELKEASKAAVEDAKSQGLLATALENTTGANRDQIAAVEASILEMSMQAAIADDQLRPAFANLARATGDVGRSTELMSLALDVAAGTGKSLDVVVKALSRAVGPDGTTGALERLAPAIKGASDPLAELERLFGGSAEKAANLDPYQRLTVVLGELSESVGVVLLPLLEKFATWFISVVPHIQKFFDEIMAALDSEPVRKAFESLDKALKNLGDSLGKLFGIPTSPEADGFVSFFVVLAGILEGIVKTVDLMVKSFESAFPVFKVFSDLVNGLVMGLMNLKDLQGGGGGGAAGFTGSTKIRSYTGQNTSNSNVTINVNNSM